jgi:hypothetical protein
MVMEVPPNFLTIITTVEIRVGTLSRIFSTQVGVQTVRWEEVQRAMDACWKATKAQLEETQLGTPAPTLPPTE